MFKFSVSRFINLVDRLYIYFLMFQIVINNFRYPPLTWYVWFGAPYFFYDAWALYKVYLVKEQKVTSTQSKIVEFLKSQPLMMVHHLVLPVLLGPAILVSYEYVCGLCEVYVWSVCGLCVVLWSMCGLCVVCMVYVWSVCGLVVCVWSCGLCVVLQSVCGLWCSLVVCVWSCSPCDFISMTF